MTGENNKDVDIMSREIEKAMLEEARKLYSEKVIDLFQHPKNLGVVPRPNGFGVVKGICGDTMKVYLKITRGKVREATFEADGCVATIATGSAITEMVKGKTLKEVMRISPTSLVEELDGLPDSHLHCSILAVNTLHRAVANYLFLNASPEE